MHVHEMRSLFLYFYWVYISTSGSDGYFAAINRDVLSQSGDLRNEVTISCRLDDEEGGLPVADPVWYFNGTLHSDHACTANATTTGNSFVITLTPECEGYLQCGVVGGTNVSLPRLLLAYPIRNLDVSPKQNVSVGDTVTVPCGVRVSATGNFEVVWTETYIRTGISMPTTTKIENPTINTNYELTVENHRSVDTSYLCQVKAVAGKDGLPIISNGEIDGLVTQVDVSFYTEPEITGITVERGDGVISFIAEALGTNRKYSWSGSNVDNIESSPTLTLSSINDGDTLAITVENTNVHGVVSRDVARAFVFITSSSAAATSIPVTFPTPMPSGLERAGANTCAPFNIDNVAGMWNVILLVFILLLVLGSVLLLGTIYLCGKFNSKNRTKYVNCLPNNQETTELDQRSNVLTIKVGHETVQIDKQKINKNNFSEFFFHMDYIMRSAMKQMGDINPDLARRVNNLNAIMTKWEDNSPNNLNQEDEARLDCTTVPKVRTIACDSTGSPAPVNEPEDRSAADISNEKDTVGSKILSLLLPSLAEKMATTNS